MSFAASVLARQQQELLQQDLANQQRAQVNQATADTLGQLFANTALDPYTTVNQSGAPQINVAGMLRDESVPEYVKQQALSLLNANPVLRRSTPAGRRAGPPVDVIGATQIPGGKWAIDVSAPERGGLMGALGNVPLIGRAFRGDPNQRAPLTMNRTSDPNDPLATFSDDELNAFFGGGVFATEAGTAALSNPFTQNSLVERLRRETAPDRAAMEAIQSIQNSRAQDVYGAQQQTMANAQAQDAGTELAILRGIINAGQGDLNTAVTELATATVASAAPPPAAGPAAPPDYAGDLRKALEGQGLTPEVMEAAEALLAPYMDGLATDPDGTIAQMTEDLSSSDEAARIGLINAMVASLPGDIMARTSAAANLAARFGVDHGMLGLDAEEVRQAQRTMQERVYAQQEALIESAGSRLGNVRDARGEIIDLVNKTRDRQYDYTKLGADTALEQQRISQAGAKATAAAGIEQANLSLDQQKMSYSIYEGIVDRVFGNENYAARSADALWAAVGAGGNETADDYGELNNQARASAKTLAKELKSIGRKRASAITADHAEREVGLREAESDVHEEFQSLVGLQVLSTIAEDDDDVDLFDKGSWYAFWGTELPSAPDVFQSLRMDVDKSGRPKKFQLYAGAPGDDHMETINASRLRKSLGAESFNYLVKQLRARDAEQE